MDAVDYKDATVMRFCRPVRCECCCLGCWPQVRSEPNAGFAFYYITQLGNHLLRACFAIPRSRVVKTSKAALWAGFPSSSPSFCRRTPMRKISQHITAYILVTCFVVPSARTSICRPVPWTSRTATDRIKNIVRQCCPRGS